MRTAFDGPISPAARSSSACSASSPWAIPTTLAHAGVLVVTCAAVGILDGKRILVTGILTDDSLAFGVARLAQAEGAEIVATGFGRAMSLTARTVRKLATKVDVLELDVNEPEQISAVAADLGERWGALDGVLHSIGFAPPSCLGGGSIVGLDFDARFAWPAYDWMGVAKAALESTSRYLARELGPHHVRVNLVAAGPARTMAAKSIPGFAAFEDAWAGRAPLGWDVKDSSSVAKAVVVLLSDWLPMTTAEMLHVDGGYHAMGA
jgi:enoyl-[acyl-carrier protein] reductase I